MASQQAAALPAEILRVRDAAARRLSDVQSVQLPRLRACTQPQELASYEAELQETLHRIGSLVQQIADEVDDAETSAERVALQSLADTQRKKLTDVRQETRRALLAAHRTTQSRQVTAARTALLGSAVQQSGSVRAAPTDRASATSEQVTGALQRTVALMSSELEKSGYSAQLLEESSETILAVSTKYASFNDLLRDSISMIKQMERAELVDFGILAASIAFFVGCVAYILYARIFSKGIQVLSLAWRASSYVGSGTLGGLASMSGFAAYNEPERIAPDRASDPIEDAIRYAAMEADSHGMERGRRRRRKVAKSSAKPQSAQATPSADVTVEEIPSTASPDVTVKELPKETTSAGVTVWELPVETSGAADVRAEEDLTETPRVDVHVTVDEVAGTTSTEAATEYHREPYADAHLPVKEGLFAEGDNTVEKIPRGVHEAAGFSASTTWDLSEKELPTDIKMPIFSVEELSSQTHTTLEPTPYAATAETSVSDLPATSSVESTSTDPSLATPIQSFTTPKPSVATESSMVFPETLSSSDTPVATEMPVPNLSEAIFEPDVIDEAATTDFAAKESLGDMSLSEPYAAVPSSELTAESDVTVDDDATETSDASGLGEVSSSETLFMHGTPTSSLSRAIEFAEPTDSAEEASRRESSATDVPGTGTSVIEPTPPPASSEPASRLRHSDVLSRDDSADAAHESSPRHDEAELLTSSTEQVTEAPFSATTEPASPAIGDTESVLEETSPLSSTPTSTPADLLDSASTAPHVEPNLVSATSVPSAKPEEGADAVSMSSAPVTSTIVTSSPSASKTRRRRPWLDEL